MSQILAPGSGITIEAGGQVLAHAAGLLDRAVPISPRELAKEFRWDKLRKEDIRLNPEAFCGQDP